MPQLTLFERTKIVKFWHQTKSVIQVQHAYRQFLNTPDAPNQKTIDRTVAKFSTVGTMCNLNKGNSGRRRSSCSAERMDVVRQAVVRSPRKSICRLSAETGIHRCSVQRILRTDLHLFS